MRIGIITFYKVPNYGSMLQAFALKTFLEHRGHSVEFIDQPYGRFQNSIKHNFLWPFLTIHPRGIPARIEEQIRIHITDFSERLPQSKRFDSVGDLRNANLSYDAVIVGSDLVWRPDWCSPRFTDIAFLDFLPPRCKRISYAASFCVHQWGDIDRGKVSSLLSKFDMIGVREDSGALIVQNLCKKDLAHVTLDPTLLINASDYCSLTYPLENHVEQPYVFQYLLEWSDGLAEQKCVESCCNAIGVHLIEKDRVEPQGLLHGIARLLGISDKIGVPEWLSRIQNAALVVTNSFHGTVFSIILHRPFVTLLIPGEMSGLNERIFSLLKKLHLENRMIYANDCNRLRAIVNSPIDWIAVDSYLSKERSNSVDFFSKCDL